MWRVAEGPNGSRTIGTVHRLHRRAAQAHAELRIRQRRTSASPEAPRQQWPISVDIAIQVYGGPALSREAFGSAAFRESMLGATLSALPTGRTLE